MMTMMSTVATAMAAAAAGTQTHTRAARTALRTRSALRWRFRFFVPLRAALLFFSLLLSRLLSFTCRVLALLLLLFPVSQR